MCHWVLLWYYLRNTVNLTITSRQEVQHMLLTESFLRIPESFSESMKQAVGVKSDQQGRKLFLHLCLLQHQCIWSCFNTRSYGALAPNFKSKGCRKRLIASISFPSSAESFLYPEDFARSTQQFEPFFDSDIDWMTKTFTWKKVSPDSPDWGWSIWKLKMSLRPWGIQWFSILDNTLHFTDEFTKQTLCL